jgi:hypothetical protein
LMMLFEESRLSMLTLQRPRTESARYHSSGPKDPVIQALRNALPRVDFLIHWRMSMPSHSDKTLPFHLNRTSMEPSNQPPHSQATSKRRLA